jgi:two-component system OmpR family response regulator
VRRAVQIALALERADLEESDLGVWPQKSANPPVRPLIILDVLLQKRELRSGDNTLVLLSSAEFDLLLMFAEHPRRVVTRDELIDLTRGSTHVAYDRDIDVQVSRLRYKVERDPRNPSILRTIRGAGYIFLPKVTRG